MTIVTTEGIAETTETATLPDMLTVSEVARHLRVDDTTVRRWVKQGAMAAVTLPHSGTRQGYRIPRKSLEKVLNNGSIA